MAVKGRCRLIPPMSGSRRARRQFTSPTRTDGRVGCGRTIRLDVRESRIDGGKVASKPIACVDHPGHDMRSGFDPCSKHARRTDEVEINQHHRLSNIQTVLEGGARYGSEHDDIEVVDNLLETPRQNHRPSFPCQIVTVPDTQFRMRFEHNSNWFVGIPLHEAAVEIIGHRAIGLRFEVS